MTQPSKPAQLEEAKLPELNSQFSPADHKRVVRRLIEEGFNRGELQLLDELLDPSYIEHQSLAPGVPPTRVAVAAMIAALRTGFPDIHLSIQAIDAIDDRVWIRLRATGTHRGPFMGNPPTGRPMSIDVIDTVRMKQGRIVEHWGVPDHLSLMEQLGL
ncbi:MAG: ester cyclase [Thermoplasmata archaeon]